MNIKTKKFALIFGFVAFGIVHTGIDNKRNSAETNSSEKNNIVQSIHNTFIFVKKFFTDPAHTGAILPSSPYLAKEITKQLRKKIKSTDKPLNVLEVGAGTGVFTQEIIKHLREYDMLDVVELDESMSKLLKEKFVNYGNANVVQGSILDFNPNGKKYDVIISGLPFNSLPEQLVKKILKQYQNKLLKKNGSISYFEYLFGAKIKNWYLSLINHSDQEEFSKLRNSIKSFHEDFTTSSNTTWLNVPPAATHHLIRTA